MIALRDGKMCHMPLEDVAGKLKYVDPQSDLVREAKALGISFRRRIASAEIHPIGPSDPARRISIWLLP